MKVRVRRTAIICVFALGVMCLMTGCATTPLQKATLKGDHARIDILLNQGHNIDEFNNSGRHPEGYPPAWLAVINNDVPTLSLLLDRGASMSFEGSFLSTLLHFAAGRHLLFTHDAIFWPKSDSSNQAMLDFLITRGEDVNAIDVAGGIRPLHRAALWGTPEAVLFLIEKGADPNARAHNGSTPLSHAMKRSKPGKQEVINIIQQAISKGLAAQVPTIINTPAALVVPDTNLPE